MNQTKTAVILSIITITLIGVVLYALRDNFKAKPAKGNKKEEDEDEDEE